MKEKLAIGVLWLSGARVLVNIMGLCSTLVLARLLTPEDFGVVAIVTTLLSIIGPVTELSLSAALIQQQAPTEEHFHTAWTMNLLRALLVGGGFCLAAPWVADFYGDTRLTGVMLAIGLSIVICGLSNPKLIVRERNLEFWPSFVMSVSNKLVGLLVGVTLALIYRNYWALIGGTLAAQLAGVAASYWLQPYRPRWSLRHFKQLWSFSIWLTLGQTVNTLNWRLDHLIVGTFLGPTALGTYVVGDNLAALPTRESTGPIQQTLFPSFRAVIHDRERLVRTYQRAQALVSAVALPIGFGVAVAADVLVPLVLGPNWGEAVLVVQVLSCVFALQTMGSTVQPLALAEGATQLMFRRDLFSFAMRVPIILLGMWWAGMPGIVYARMVTGVLAIGINMYVVQRLIGLSLLQQVGNTARSLISVAAMVIALLGLCHDWSVGDTAGQRLVYLLLLGATGGVVYTAVHLFSWRLSGRPVGPESDLLGFLYKARDRVRAYFGRA